ncbi:MAG TPA: signal peptide peptidase SppA [Gemmataceae bacterium]|nr:signal peptide peptidase SppA [Gemmataceae bacterium]
MILALILFIFLSISLLYNVGNFASNLLRGRGVKYTRTVGPRLEEAVYEDNDSGNKIALVQVDGIISGSVIDQGGYSLVDLIKAQLRRAEDDDRVKAVLLKVDSPGGEVLASDDIYRAIKDFQSRTHKPVIASMGSLAASGGYYISSPCRWIVANELTITGSIGVIMSSWNYRGLMDKVGVLPQVFKSGKYKDMLSGSREPNSITPEEKAMVQSLIDETFARFKSVVREGRTQAYDQNKDRQDKGRALSDDWQDYADGRVLSGTEALKLGFVDQLGGFDDAVERTKKLAGISQANLIQYQQRFDLSDVFRLFGKSDANGSIKVDLGMEMPKLQAGKLYFLSPTFLH